MEQHVKILGVLNIVWGAMGALGGLVLLVIFGGVYGIVGGRDRPQPRSAYRTPYHCYYR